jgi:carboxyl-terminal processing protease
MDAKGDNRAAQNARQGQLPGAPDGIDRPHSSQNSMTSHNIKLLFLVLVVCAFCYGKAQKNRDLGDLSLAMDIIEQEYIEKPSREKLYQAAMKGMIDSLDPYSAYIPVESLKPFQAVFDQEFGGLGVSLDGPPRRERLTVVATVFDSPAYRAGILPGDVILKIDDFDSEKEEVENVSTRMRGREGTEVTLTIERAGAPEPLRVAITRAKIEVESVLGDRRRMDGKWEFKMEADERIAYFRVELFGEKTTSELESAIRQVSGQCKAIVIDLRDNTGGLLNAATEICDMFLNDGEMVSTLGRDRRVDEVYSAKQGTALPDSVPIAVLINEHSASASEVLAACLQDRCRATIVGTRSYGKGSVQNVIPLDAGMAAMRLTTARYYPPSGRNIHREKDAKPEETWGVMPDSGCEVKLNDEAFKKLVERVRKRSDPIANGMSTNAEKEPTDDAVQNQENSDPSLPDDPQLQKAVQVLQGKLKSKE